MADSAQLVTQGLELPEQPFGFAFQARVAFVAAAVRDRGRGLAPVQDQRLGIGAGGDVASLQRILG
jgi:hypothetical protein